MADTEFGTNDVQTVKRWSDQLAREAIGEMYSARLMGVGPDNFIQIYKDLEKQAGDQIKHHLHARATGGGRYGSQQLEDFEEEMLFPQDTFTINQLRKAHRFDQMSQQRVVFDLREEAKASLKNWFAEAFDTIIACKLAGTIGVDALPVDVDVTFDGNSLRTPDSAHRIQNGGGGGSTFTLGLLDRCKAMAKTLRPRIRPVRVDGRNYHAALLTPETVYQIKSQTGETGWKLIQERAQVRGDENPVFTGALGIYNGVILWEWEYLPKDTTAGAETCYNLFLGAQAGAAAFGGRRVGPMSAQSGQLFSWREQDKDYGDKMGVGGATIFGVQQSKYDHDDDGTATTYGLIRIETKDPAVS
jgi:N4-gp56 family major capsid protein